jgi:hypothetical protein
MLRLHLTPYLSLSPAFGEIFNMKWRGGDRGRGKQGKRHKNSELVRSEGIK